MYHYTNIIMYKLKKKNCVYMNINFNWKSNNIFIFVLRFDVLDVN
jgi:hypothetical protein